MRKYQKMNATRWMDDVNAGITSINAAAVSIERMKHQTAVMLQTLDEMEETPTLLQKIKEWFTR